MKLKELYNSAEVMKAFLDGKRLVNTVYGKSEPDSMWLYLEKTGYIAEEDGAGAKADRVPILMRNNEKWFEIVEENKGENMTEFKLKHGYGYIRDYLTSHHKTLRRNAETDEDYKLVTYVEELLHDLEYLELCAKAVDKLRDAKEGFDLIKKL